MGRKRPAGEVAAESDNDTTSDFVAATALPKAKKRAPRQATSRSAVAGPANNLPPPTPAAKDSTSPKRASRDRQVVSPSPALSTFSLAAAKSKARTPRGRAKEPLTLRPTEELTVYVFGNNAEGQLGLPSPTRATISVPGVDVVPTPRLNTELTAQGLVQVAAGSTHGVALTSDGRVLSWGCPDLGALGRGVVSDSDSGRELSGEIGEVQRAWSEDTVITQVAACQTSGFALTNMGDVWGWGSFRNNEGVIGVTATDDSPSFTPTKLTSLTGITKITTAPNANHLLALSSTGVVFALGAGEQNQLGRRLLERSKRNGLVATRVPFSQAGTSTATTSTPKRATRAKIVDIAASDESSFAIDEEGRVWSWGRNDFGQLGRGFDLLDPTASKTTPSADDAVAPALCAALSTHKRIVKVAGGRDFTVVITETGASAAWGRVDGGYLGINAKLLDQAAEVGAIRRVGDGTAPLANVMSPSILTRAIFVTTPAVGKLVDVNCSSHGAIAVDEDGNAWAWGAGGGFALGTGREKDELKLRNMASSAGTLKKKGRKFVSAALGVGWGMLVAREW